MGNSLKEKAILLTLSISAYNGYKTDTKGTKKVNEIYVTEANAGKFNKKLIPDATKNITNEISKLRVWHSSVTLPWDNNGRSIILTKGDLPYLKEFAIKKNTIMAAINNQADNLPLEIKKDEIRLGNLFDFKDYPTKEEFISAYKIKLLPEQIPDSDDFRVDLNKKEVDSLRSEIETVFKERETDAMKTLWNRLYTVVSHLSERLKDPEAVFKNSAVTNIEEICNILPTLNITEDPELDAMVVEIQKKITNHDPDNFRYELITRRNVSNETENILKKMEAYL